MTIATTSSVIKHAFAYENGGSMMRNSIEEFLEILDGHRHHLHLVFAMLLLYYVRSNNNNNNTDSSNSNSRNKSDPASSTATTYDSIRRSESSSELSASTIGDDVDQLDSQNNDDSIASQLIDQMIPKSFIAIYSMLQKWRQQQQKDSVSAFFPASIMTASTLASADISTATMVGEEAKTEATRPVSDDNDRATITKPKHVVEAIATTASNNNLLTIVPKDLIANEILGRGYISDKTIKQFLIALGEKRVKDLYKLDQRFCLKHGSKLEDPDKFQNHNFKRSNNKNNGPIISKRYAIANFVAAAGQEEDEQQSASSSPDSSSLILCCPECYAEEQHSKRCNSCKKFYQQYSYGNENKNNEDSGGIGGPGLWCQSCERMAFCNACLSNDVDGCGTGSDDDDDDGTANNRIGTSLAFGVPPRRPRRDISKRGIKRFCCAREPGRITCHNCCCPNVFTNTMCGEFVCDDCGEQHAKNLNNNNNNSSSEAAETGGGGSSSGNVVEVCEECGKATCLDPHCLVCSDFRLIHISCNFVADDAYQFRGMNGYFATAESVTKVRRAITDIFIYGGFLFILYKMWWHRLLLNITTGDGNYDDAINDGIKNANHDANYVTNY